MLQHSAYARQLEAKLDDIGNSHDAVAALLDALERMDSSETDELPFDPSPEDWQEFDNWLERLEYERRFNVNAHFV